jgi:tetratricopeptide (TPR) repeat protein
LGHAQEYNGLDGLANLNEGIRLHDSLLGRALRASALSNRAFDTRDREQAEEALKDADAAQRMMADNPMLLQHIINARVIAAVIYQEANLPENRTAILKLAGRDVQVLEPFLDDLPTVFFPMWFFYEQNGQRDKALQVALRSLAKSGSPLAANFSAITLYHQGKIEEAVHCFDRRRQQDLLGDITRLFILAELSDGKRRVLHEYEKCAHNQPESELCYWKDIFLLLGEKEKAVAMCQKGPEPDVKQSREDSAFSEAQGRFERGEISRDAYLAKAGASRQRQAAAHYHMGLLRLSEGDRLGAKDHFREGARPCWGYHGYWCQMFFSRLEKDKSWPEWIRVKK